MQRSGPFEMNGNQPTSNVFIADFVELNNFKFCRTVIELNDKIFKELMSEQSNGNDNEPQDLIKIHPNTLSDNNCIDNSNVQL